MAPWTAARPRVRRRITGEAAWLRHLLEDHMGKRARKKKARKGSSANHGKRPNS